MLTCGVNIEINNCCFEKCILFVQVNGGFSYKELLVEFQSLIQGVWYLHFRSELLQEIRQSTVEVRRTIITVINTGNIVILNNDHSIV